LAPLPLICVRCIRGASRYRTGSPPVHGGAIVPQQKDADAQAMPVAQIVALDVRPQRVEQGVGFRRRQTLT